MSVLSFDIDLYQILAKKKRYYDFFNIEKHPLAPQPLQNCKTVKADRHNNKNKVHNYVVQKNLIPAEICIHLEDLALNDCSLVTAGCRDLQVVLLSTGQVQVQLFASDCAEMPHTNNVYLTNIQCAGPGCFTEALTHIFIFLRDVQVKGLISHVMIKFDHFGVWMSINKHWFRGHTRDIFGFIKIL